MLTLTPLITLHAAGTPAPGFAPHRLSLPTLPTMAFGDGSHPTTRLMAGAVDLLCRQRRPQRILDVGTGTGILARIARARGAGTVIGTDIDPNALASARSHAALDAHAVEIQISEAAPDSWGPSFDLVIANILEGPLRELAPALRAALAPGGALLVSGFTPRQTPSLRVSFGALGLGRFVEAHLEGWALLMAEVDAPSAIR